MDLDRLVDELREKVDTAWEAVNRSRAKDGQDCGGKKLAYLEGVHDGLEQAWREAVFARHAATKSQSGLGD